MTQEPYLLTLQHFKDERQKKMERQKVNQVGAENRRLHLLKGNRQFYESAGFQGLSFRSTKCKLETN
jgi:hypothetical protein